MGYSIHFWRSTPEGTFPASPHHLSWLSSVLCFSPDSRASRREAIDLYAECVVNASQGGQPCSLTEAKALHHLLIATGGVGERIAEVLQPFLILDDASTLSEEGYGLVGVGAAGDRLCLAMLNAAGTLDLSHNWTKPGWRDSHSGLTGIINDDGTHITGTDPGFVDEFVQDYTLVIGAKTIDAGTTLLPEVLPANAATRPQLRYGTCATGVVH